MRTGGRDHTIAVLFPVKNAGDKKDIGRGFGRLFCGAGGGVTQCGAIGANLRGNHGGRANERYQVALEWLSQNLDGDLR